MLRHAARCSASLLLALALPMQARAAGVPSTLHAQGVLRQSAGGLESGTFTLVFRLYDHPSAGNALFTETQANVAVESGVFSVRVGSGTPLPATLFTDHARLFLGVEVMGDAGGELTPRIELGSVPYALQAAHADDAQTLDGEPSSAFQRTLAVTAPLQLMDNTLSLSVQGCPTGSPLEFDGTAWGCGTDNDSGGDISAVTAGGGLAGGGTNGAITLALMTCDDGQILKRAGGAWTCATDDNSLGDILSVTTADGSGLAGGVMAGNANLSLASCNPGELLKFDLMMGWTCSPDDSGPVYTAGAGLQLVAGALSVANDGVTSAMVADNSLDTVDVNAIDVAKITGAARLAGNNTFTGSNEFTGNVVLNRGAEPDATLTETGIAFNSTTNTVFTVANAGTGVARLQLEAPAAAGATLNVPPGAAPTTPANGDVWNETAVPGLRVSAGGATQRLGGVVCALTPNNDAITSNTTASDFVTNCVLPAASLTPGRVLRITAGGLMSNNGNGDTNQLALQVNETNVFANAFTGIGTTGTNRPYLASVTLIVQAASASSVTFEGNGTVTLPGGPARVTLDSITGAITVPVSNGTYVLEVQTAWGAVDSNDSLSLREFVVELL